MERNIYAKTHLLSRCIRAASSRGAQSSLPSSTLHTQSPWRSAAHRPQCLPPQRAHHLHHFARPTPRRPHASALQPQQRRPFTSTPSRPYKTVEEARSRYRSGPFSWVAAMLFIAAGSGLYVYFQYEKARMERARIAEAAKGVGRPKVAGAFTLVDQEGRTFTDRDLRGKYALVYFGFTHCPDICPEELDKMAQMVELVKEACGDVMRPVFVTCDPARDTPEVVKAYLNEFHPDLIGLTGTWEQVKAVCKLYRVYFSTPPNVLPGQDYLVDHSIYFYLMDPDGDFVEAIGRQHSASRAAKIIAEHVGDWKGKLDKS